MKYEEFIQDHAYVTAYF